MVDQEYHEPVIEEMITKDLNVSPSGYIYNEQSQTGENPLHSPNQLSFT